MAEAVETRVASPTEAANTESGEASVGDAQSPAPASEQASPSPIGAQPVGVSPVIPPELIALPEGVRHAIDAPTAGSPAAKRRGAREQVVDPQVSYAKFDREVEWLRRYEMAQRQRGLLLIEAAFPRVVIAVCVPQVRPYVLLFGVIIDYTNWDVEPPSVRLIDPFTFRPLVARELSTWMKRRVNVGAPDFTPAVPQVSDEQVAPGRAPAPVAGAPVQESAILQWSGPDDFPFLCLAGVLEYHEHPAHTGDSWWLHRTTGAGSLSHLLNVFHSYAIAPITGFMPAFDFRPVNGAVQIEVRGVQLTVGQLPA